MASRQFMLFLLAGGIAAATNLGSRILFSLSLPYVPAIVLAYCVGMVTAFTLNRRFVFTNTDNPVRTQAAWFITINLLAVLQTIVISLILARWLFPVTGMSFFPETVAHAFGVTVPVMTSYIGHKTLTFRKSGA